MVRDCRDRLFSLTVANNFAIVSPLTELTPAACRVTAEHGSRDGVVGGTAGKGRGDETTEAEHAEHQREEPEISQTAQRSASFLSLWRGGKSRISFLENSRTWTGKSRKITLVRASPGINA